MDTGHEAHASPTLQAEIRSIGRVACKPEKGALRSRERRLPPRVTTPVLQFKIGLESPALARLFAVQNFPVGVKIRRLLVFRLDEQRFTW